MPLYVLSHGIPFGEPFPGFPSDAAEAVMAKLQNDLALLVPDAKHVIATESGHNIHQDQPELVIEAIRAVVDAVRNPSPGPVQPLRGLAIERRCFMKQIQLLRDRRCGPLWPLFGATGSHGALQRRGNVRLRLVRE